MRRNKMSNKHRIFDKIHRLVKKAGLKPGQEFTDLDGDKCIYLGVGAWRTNEMKPLTLDGSTLAQVYTLSFKPMSHIYTYFYRGEWHMNSFEELDMDTELIFTDLVEQLIAERGEKNE
jgi:hypothetical protein